MIKSSHQCSSQQQQKYHSNPNQNLLKKCTMIHSSCSRHRLKMERLKVLVVVWRGLVILQCCRGGRSKEVWERFILSTLGLILGKLNRLRVLILCLRLEWRCSHFCCLPNILDCLGLSFLWRGWLLFLRNMGTMANIYHLIIFCFLSTR